MIVLLSFLGLNSATKRLVLHSDDDVLQTLSTLQTEVSTLTTKFQTEVGALKTEISSLKSALSSVTAFNIGSTYIRWGRTVCPSNGSELIYHGFMAGSKYSETGGSSKSLCLPADPMWGKYVDGYNGDAVIRGTEIDINLQISAALFGKNVYNHDIPCAVCRSSRSAHVMIPARTRCYAGWTMEYTGYVVSANPAYNSNVDYVCLDESLEFLPHGAGDDNDNVVNPVEVECGTLGSLPCPPYVNGRELACVVCTK